MGVKFYPRGEPSPPNPHFRGMICSCGAYRILPQNFKRANIFSKCLTNEELYNFYFFQCRSYGVPIRLLPPPANVAHRNTIIKDDFLSPLTISSNFVTNYEFQTLLSLKPHEVTTWNEWSNSYPIPQWGSPDVVYVDEDDIEPETLIYMSDESDIELLTVT